MRDPTLVQHDLLHPRTRRKEEWDSSSIPNEGDPSYNGGKAEKTKEHPKHSLPSQTAVADKPEGNLPRSRLLTSHSLHMPVATIRIGIHCGVGVKQLALKSRPFRCRTCADGQS